MRIPKITWSRLGVATVTLAMVGYLCWVATPFDEKIKVHVTGGLPQERIEELIAHARDLGAFPESRVRDLRREGRWTPWKRGELFISIEVRQNDVAVMAGIYQGPLNAGGCGFDAKWTGSRWEFSRRRKWMS